MSQRTLEEVSSDECLALIRGETIGRLVYHDDDGPAAVPVNYRMAGEHVVFRVEEGTKLRALRTGRIAFEVDHVDVKERAGWSVLIRGVGLEVDIERVPELLRRMDDGPPTPWAEGVHNIWVEIVPEAVTGRRLAAAFFAPVL